MVQNTYRLQLFRPRRFGLLTAGALTIALGAPGLAMADNAWTVTEASGSAMHRLAAGQSLPLKAGDMVAEGDSVQTGSDGHAVLQHHDHTDTLTVSPGTQFRVPDPRHDGTAVTVIQSTGALQFDVEHTPGRRFEVDSPYLAAVVKGTSFTVQIGPSGGQVDVARGAVEVQSLDTHRAVLVRPGEFAAVALGHHDPVLGTKQGTGTAAPGADGKSSFNSKGTSGPSAANTIGDIHLDVGSLTNGLVSNAAPGGAVAATANAAAAANAFIGGAGSTAGGGPSAGPVIGGGPGTSAVLPGGTAALGAVAATATTSAVTSASVVTGPASAGPAGPGASGGPGKPMPPAAGPGQGTGPGNGSPGAGNGGPGPGLGGPGNGGPGPGLGGPGNGGSGPGLGGPGKGKGNANGLLNGNGPDGGGPPGLLKKLVGILK